MGDILYYIYIICLMTFYLFIISRLTANFVFKPIKIDESDILFELYSPYGGRKNLGIRGIDLDKEERRVYTFLEVYVI